MKNAGYIPASIRREVWARDGGTCAFVSHDGRRCGSTYRLDFHHLRPFARGGPSTVENLSLRCRAHNLYEADLEFGEAFMDAHMNASVSTGEKKFPGETGVADARTATPPDDFAPNRS